MSLTATISSEAVAEWARVFPKQVTENYTSSVQFMKQLTTVAVSTISYLKDLFPEESYTTEKFGDIKLRILKRTCKDELAQFVSTTLAHAFEAFDKKYLQRLALCIYDGACDADNLVECHTFEYSYAPAGVTMNVRSKSLAQAHNATYTFDNVRQRTVQMIRTCVVILATYNQLPPYYDVSLRLYYNDDAPAGYQAPGFLSPAEVEDHLPGAAGFIKLGSVATPYHRLVLSTYQRQALGASQEAQPSQNAPMMTQNESNDFNSADESYTEESTAPRVVCACGKTDTDDDLMLTCQYCNTQQHGACFGRMARTARTAAHCCTRCSDADARREPGDARLATLTHKRECLCILRRTLAWLRTRREVSVPALVDKFQLTQLNAHKLLKMLQGNGVIDHVDTDIMSPRRINNDKLRSMIAKHFDSEDSLVARLVAETLSQGDISDPVGDVLGPIEQVNLKNASTVGKIIEPPQQDTIMVDATLKQYKEVVLSNQQTEELPLIGEHNPVKVMEAVGKRNGKRKAAKEKERTGVRNKRAKTTLQ